MDGRILLASSSVIGATLGVMLMAMNAPDTGGGVAPASTMAPMTAMSAPPRGATPDIATRPSTDAAAMKKAAAARVADRANPFGAAGDPGDGWGDGGGDNPFGEPAEGGNPFGEPAKGGNPFAGAGDNPFGEPAGDNPFAVPAGDNPFGAPAEGDNPFAQAEGWGDAWTAPETRSASDALPSATPPDQPKQPAALLGAKTDLPGDVRGVGRLFRERDGQVKQCLAKDAPEALPGERRVMIRVYLAPRAETPTKAGIQKIEAPKDDDGRYTSFLTCLTGVVNDAVFELPSQGSASVNWSLRR